MTQPLPEPDDEPIALPMARAGGSVEDTFIQQWGDMGAAWGINRTMAEIQGLLYITGDTLCADDVMARLGVSRGNVSMSLRALVDWGVVRKVHRRGDRRDYYQSLTDVWEIFSRIARQRKRKEVDPIVAALKECRDRLDKEEAGGVPTADRAVVRERLEKMLEFLATVQGLAERFFGSEKMLAMAFRLLIGRGS
jgi:HTH-type transcriptional regulator, glycine betaine synthesis regulator